MVCHGRRNSLKITPTHCRFKNFPYLCIVKQQGSNGQPDKETAKQQKQNNMSSFVVNKEDYIKFAGIVSGICANTKKSVYTKDIYSHIVRCYERNVASVNEQYNDNAEPEKKAYKNTFVSWEQKGGYIYNAAMKDKRVAMRTINELSHFVASCLYQTLCVHISTWLSRDFAVKDLTHGETSKMMCSTISLRKWSWMKRRRKKTQPHQKKSMIYSVRLWMLWQERPSLTLNG